MLNNPTLTEFIDAIDRVFPGLDREWLGDLYLVATLTEHGHIEKEKMGERLDIHWHLSETGVTQVHIYMRAWNN